jgi:DMSO/TMAO reductase YedYZ molybdopterin-dependent catalytic subunit
LEEAGVSDETVEVVFTGLDQGMERGVEQRYERSLPLSEALGGDSLLAYEMNGQPLPPQHGFPVRLVVPGWYGMANVKWLTKITCVKEPFEGYQHLYAYRFRADEEDPGSPLTRMMPRSLMVPPGFPDFGTRKRYVRLGHCRIEGRAWSGWGTIEKVEVSTDGGRQWSDATLGEHISPSGWLKWTYDWHVAEPGDHLLSSRARDSAGNVQPLEIPWNVGGYANNAVQRVPVTVLSPE